MNDETPLLLATLERLESKLDMALEMMHKHEGVIQALKWIVGPILAVITIVQQYIMWRK